MKKLLITILMIAGFFINENQAQEYNSAVGLRLGVPTSISYKTFINSTNAVELFGGIRSRKSYTQIDVSAGYLFHNDLEEVDNLDWYYGVGAGVAVFNYDDAFVGDKGGVSISALGFIGLEYTFSDLPLSASVDWVPRFYIGGQASGFGAGYGALAVRYILNRSGE